MPASSRRKSGTCAFIAALVLVAFAAPAQEFVLSDAEQAFLESNPVIRVGAPENLRPLLFRQGDEWRGVSAEYMDALARQSGLGIEVVYESSWPELQSMLVSGEIDVIPSLYWTEDRSHLFNFSRPYISLSLSVYTRADRDDINSMSDLGGRTMAMPSGYAALERIVEGYPDMEVLVVDDFQESVYAVVEGRADAFFASRALFLASMEEAGLNNLKNAFPVPDGEIDLFIATRRDAPELASILDKSLAALPKPQAKAIVARWTGDAASVSEPTELKFTPMQQAWLSARSGIVACIQESAMPFEAHTDSGHAGVTRDYAAILSAKTNLSISTITSPDWASVEANLLGGRCDFAPLAVDTTNRELLFTAPYTREKLALVTESDRPFFEYVSELSSVRVAAVEGFAKTDELRRLYPHIDIESVTTRKEAYEGVLTGRFFGAFDLIQAASSRIHHDYEGRLKISSVVDKTEAGLRFATRSPQLASIAGKVLATVPPSQRETIISKWVSSDDVRQFNYKLIVQFVLGSSLVLGFMLFRLAEVRRHKESMSEKTVELEEANRKLEQQKHSAMHLAYHDQLTGLSNRSKLMLDLEHSMKLARRTGNQLAVMFLDLDRFKYVNDSLGHDVGDKLLVSVAKRISGLLRDTDQLSRIGGDEFIVILENIDNDYSPSIVAQRIIESLTQPFRIDSQPINIGTSIGIALYPDNTDEINTLLKYADSAMYSAKDAGRNDFRYFQHEMSSKASRRMMIESALRRALEQQDFSLVLQPIVCLRTGRVAKAEALIRWTHPVAGIIAPDEFIPIAEEYGLIAEIGEWVYRSSCEIIATLDAMGNPLQSICINVSGAEFTKGNIAKRFSRIAEEVGIHPGQVELEITEGKILGRNEQVEEDLQRLQAAGHSISVDDFGTGYSSLSYLKRLPLNTIKIDRSFIKSIPKDPNDIEISQAIISLSHALGYSVVAEGVESVEQMAFLVERDCDFAQGYYFSRPVPLEEFMDVVETVNERLKDTFGKLPASQLGS